MPMDHSATAAVMVGADGQPTFFQRLPRGKRRGDCCAEEENLLHNATFTSHIGNGDCTNVMKAKRHCLGLSHIQPSQQCNNEPVGFLNGHCNGHGQEERFQHEFESWTAQSEMETDTSIEPEKRRINGFHNTHQDGEDLHQRTNSKPPTPVILNGYYGYIAHYEHAGSDCEDEGSMDVVKAEYAVNGSPACILPKERRVCSRCSAGEPGHITHIIGQ